MIRWSLVLNGTPGSAEHYAGTLHEPSTGVDRIDAGVEQPPYDDDSQRVERMDLCPEQLDKAAEIVGDAVGTIKTATAAAGTRVPDRDSTEAVAAIEGSKSAERSKTSTSPREEGGQADQDV